MEQFVEAISASFKDLEETRIDKILIVHLVDGKSKKLIIRVVFEKKEAKISYLVEDYNGLSLMNTKDLSEALIRYNAIPIPLPLISTK